MRKRPILVIAGGVLVLTALAVLYLHVESAPRTTRLLPEADAIVFLNLAPLRRATHFDRDPITRSPDFQHFIDATGIVPERDLDSAAFALHTMPDPHGPNGPAAFSEIFTGRFDPARLSKYLAAIASAQETYAGHTLYDIPSDGRTLRVTLLDNETIAASNCPTPEQIHAMLDRRRTRFAASASLLAALYPDVPAFSTAWAIGRIGLPFAENGRISVMGLALPLAADSSFVASLRYTSSLHLRIVQLTPSPADAQQSAQQLTGLLALVRTLEPIPSRTPADRALRELTAAIHIEPQNDRAILSADLSPDLLKRLANSR
jgi:hypothetical protein